MMVVRYKNVVDSADVHRSLELLEEYHSELFRSSDIELKLAIERVINVFKHSLFNALCGQ